ncbi:MAG: hypothetical protein AB8B95_08935 [Pseudohongiellaceae bacterium]
MKTLLYFFFVNLSLLYSVLVLGQSQTVSTATGATGSIGSLPTEIIVTPLMNRRHLRSLIAKTEEDFVNRFNELNLDEKYDIDCYRYRSTRSHIRKRICEPKFFRDSRRADASLAALNINQFKAGGPVWGLLELVQVQSDSQIRWGHSQDYQRMREKVVNLTNSDEALKTLIHNLNELSAGLKSYGKDD